MRTLKRWLPELACILFILLSAWILQSPHRTETARVWMHRALSMAGLSRSGLPGPGSN